MTTDEKIDRVLKLSGIRPDQADETHREFIRSAMIIRLSERQISEELLKWLGVERQEER